MFEKPLIRKDLSKKEHEFRSYDREFLGHPKIILKGYVTELDRIQNSIKENDIYNHISSEINKHSLNKKKSQLINNSIKLSKTIKSIKDTSINDPVYDSIERDSYKKKLYFKAVQTIPLDMGSLRFQERRNPNAEIENPIESALERKASNIQLNLKADLPLLEKIKMKQINSKKALNLTNEQNIPAHTNIKAEILPEIQKKAKEAANIVMNECNISKAKVNKILKKGEGTNIMSYREKIRKINPEIFSFKV